MKKVAECLYLNESSGTYFALVKRGGQQIRRSLKTQDRKLANRRLKEFRENAAKLSPKADERKLPFEALAARWLKRTNATLKPSSALRNVRCVERLEDSFRGKTVAAVSRLDCENWMAMRSRAVGARTFNYELQVLKRVFRYAMDSGIVISNPAESLERKKERKKAIVIPSREEFGKLVSELESMTKKDARNRHAVNLVKLLAFSGMRLGEGIRIVWREIDFDRNVFTVSGGTVGTKNGETRIVPLFPVLRSFLEELRSNPDGIRNSENSERSELDKENGIPHPDSRIIKIESAKKALKSACKNSGIPDFTHHCLRHYFVSNAIELGIDFKVIASWVGHNDGGILVSKTYGHLRDPHSQEMAKLMV